MAVVLAVGPSARLAAQVSLRISAGARYSTPLVRDSLVVPLDLRTAIAPAVAVGLRDALKGPWTVDGALEVSRARLNREESGTATDIGSVSIIALTVGLRRGLGSNAGARLGVGGLAYGGNSTGVFASGSGGLFPLLSLGGTYAPRLGAARGFEVGLQYDLHRFITPALRNTGFNKARPVHRLALTVSARILGK